MNGKEIHKELKRLEGISSRTQKVGILATLLKDEAFTRVIELAYSPRYIYGIGEKTLKELRAYWTTRMPGPTHSTRGFSVTEESLILDIAQRKVTGDAMIDRVKASLDLLDTEGADLLLNILKKDLRAGFSTGYINEAKKGTIPVTPYMRCSLPKSAKPENWDWSSGEHYVQLKADGTFANIIVKQTADGLTAEIQTRQGQVYSEGPFSRLLQAAKHTFNVDTVTHGEIVVWDSESNSVLPREIGNGMINSMSNGTELGPTFSLVYQAWDQVPLERWVDKGTHDVPYWIRFDALQGQILTGSRSRFGKSIELIPTYFAFSYKEAKAEFARQLQLGNEGTVLKNRMAFWKDGTSSGQVKFKLEFVVELRVKGFTEGNGKNANTFGSLECESECGQLQVNVSGMKDDIRGEINDDREGWMRAIVSVKANGVLFGDDTDSANGPAASLYLPVFVERRTDKTEADDLDRILAQRDAVIEAM